MPKGGPCESEHFRCRTQPFAGLFLEQVELAESGDATWTDFISTGPTQSGKTTTCCLIPMMYALFELQENVIFGIPTMKLASNKWKRDIEPIIGASRYRDLLPSRGPGSQGGSGVATVFFKNGTTLRFMTAGGGREERSSETARWLIVTEADSFSETDEAGGEGRKIDQLIARTHSFGHRRRVFAECTVTEEKAFIWDTYTKKSSSSVIVSQCRSCGEWIRPERQHLLGWQEATTQIEAGRLARWMCEKCGVLFDEATRQEMVAAQRLIHRGQVIGDDGAVSGPVPETRTFGFRWNGFDNKLSWTTDFIAEQEHSASKSKERDLADIAMRQQTWTLPLESEGTDLIELDGDKIQQRVSRLWTKGLIPADTEIVTIGSDIGKKRIHWTLLAHRPNGCVHVADYGTEQVPHDTMEIQRAIRFAMLRISERVGQGWPVEGRPGRVLPEQIFVDSGWGDYADLVYEICRSFGVRYRAIKGFGFGQGKGFADTSYTAPNKTSSLVKLVGSGWHLVELEEKSFELVHIDANIFKTRLQTSITEKDRPDSFTLFDGDNSFHDEYKRHLCSETPRTKSKFVDGVWKVQEVWVRVGKQNHYLDSTCYGLAAAEFVRLVRAARAANGQAVHSAESQGFTKPDGTPFFVGART